MSTWTSSEPRRRTSGWVVFAGTTIFVGSVLNLLYGLTMLLNDEWVVLTPEAIIAFDLTVVGAVTLVLGILGIMTALGIFHGDLWARIVGIIVASLNIIAQMAFMSIYADWSWLMIFINVLILYGLAAHGDEVADL